MADALKVLGQVAPAAAAAGTLYTAPAATQAMLSTIYACNRGSVAAKIRVSVAVAGAVADDKQFLEYDRNVPPYSSWPMTCGISLAATDVVRVQSDTGNVSFSAFGVEVT